MVALDSRFYVSKYDIPVGKKIQKHVKNSFHILMYRIFNVFVRNVRLKLMPQLAGMRVYPITYFERKLIRKIQKCLIVHNLLLLFIFFFATLKSTINNCARNWQIDVGYSLCKRGKDF